MNYIGGIDGMNFTPISNYNNMLKQTKALDVDSSNMSFENVLQNQQNVLKGGIEASKFDDIFAQNVKSLDNNSPVSSLINGISSSVNGGLNNVNKAVHSADMAQEAFARGENVSVHDVMIAAEKASLNMQLAMQLRSKLMNAYTELNNVKV